MTAYRVELSVFKDLGIPTNTCSPPWAELVSAKEVVEWLETTVLFWMPLLTTMRWAWRQNQSAHSDAEAIVPMSVDWVTDIKSNTEK